MGSASIRFFLLLLLLVNNKKATEKISYSLHAPLKTRGEVNIENAGAKGINSKVLSVSRKSPVEKLIKFFFLSLGSSYDEFYSQHLYNTSNILVRFRGLFVCANCTK